MSQELNLDFTDNSVLYAALPPAGDNRAIITNAELSFKPDSVRLNIRYKCQDSNIVIFESLCIDACPTSSSRGFLVEGRRGALQLCQAVNVEPKFKSEHELQSALLNQELVVYIQLRERDGVPEAVIRQRSAVL